MTKGVSKKKFLISVEISLEGIQNGFQICLDLFEYFPTTVKLIFCFLNTFHFLHISESIFFTHFIFFTLLSLFSSHFSFFSTIWVSIFFTLFSFFTLLSLFSSHFGICFLHSFHFLHTFQFLHTFVGKSRISAKLQKFQPKITENGLDFTKHSATG